MLGRLVGETACLLFVVSAPLLLTHASPDAIGLASAEGVLPALLQDGAVLSNGLCSFDPSSTGTASLSFGVEENRGIHAEAGPPVLPLPEGGDRAGQTR